MSLFGGPGKVKKRDWAQVKADSKRAQRESAELRRQVSKQLMSPARATDAEIRGNMVRIDHQLVHLEKLGRTVDTNREAYGSINAERGRLREQRRGLLMMRKAKKKGIKIGGGG